MTRQMTTNLTGDNIVDSDLVESEIQSTAADVIESAASDVPSSDAIADVWKEPETPPSGTEAQAPRRKWRSIWSLEQLAGHEAE